MSDCSSGDGFNETDSKQVPHLLAERGLTQEVWLQWVAKLRSEVLPRCPPLGQFGNCLAIVTLLGCPFYFSRLGEYHDCVRRWVDEFNAQVLHPLNMFATTQSAYCQIKHHRRALTWVAVATTPEEVAALQKEARIWLVHEEVLVLGGNSS